MTRFLRASLCVPLLGLVLGCGSDPAKKTDTPAGGTAPPAKNVAPGKAPAPPPLPPPPPLPGKNGG